MYLNNNSLSQMYGDFLEGELHMTSEKNICIQGYNSGPGGGGVYFRNFWVGICRWDPGTLNQYQS